MQCGVPSIISKQSGCAEILNYAVKVDYWDIEAMADAMYSLITYPAMHKFLKEEGKREVDNIKWEYAGLKIRRIYEQAINNH
jgi:glycosyltransferase involved in cell wall biosynthesis